MSPKKKTTEETVQSTLDSAAGTPEAGKPKEKTSRKKNARGKTNAKKTDSKKSKTKKAAVKTPKAKKTTSKKATKTTPEFPLLELPGVGEATREKLIAAGYDSVEKISRSNPTTLAKKVDGLGSTGAKEVVEAAKIMDSGKTKTKTKTTSRKKTKTTTSKEDSKKSEEDVPSEMAIPLVELPGIGKVTREKLIAAGYDSVLKISRSKPSTLAKKIDGLGSAGAKTAVEGAKEIIQSSKKKPSVVEKKPTKSRKKLTTKKQSPKEKTPPKTTKDTRRVKPKKEVAKTKKPIRKKSGLPVPERVTELGESMKRKWAEAAELVEAGEVEETVEVVALSAESTRERIVEEALAILQETMTTGRPAFEIPSRSGDNIVWDEVRDLLLLGMKTISRPYHSLASVVDATRTARLMEIVFRLLTSNLHATKREVFYSDVNLFRDQKYSDKIMEDVASMMQTTRDSIHIVASARGSAMGRVVIRDGGDLIDLTKMGTGGWAITPFLDQVDIVESDAEFIILSEKDAAVMRLAEAKYWNRQPCIVITGKGSGDIATRAFLKRLVKELEIPAFALVDSDPYGHYIYSVFLRGSKRLSYESPFIATPELKLLGVLSRDLDGYKIPKAVRIPMEPTDIKRVRDMLKEPFIRSNKEWVEDLRLMLQMKEKAEIQAFASHSFEFLTDEYVPTKLETGDWI